MYLCCRSDIGFNLKELEQAIQKKENNVFYISHLKLGYAFIKILILFFKKNTMCISTIKILSRKLYYLLMHLKTHQGIIKNYFS